MKLRSLSLFAAFACSLAASHGASAQTVYNQPTNLADSWYSISGYHWNAYDDFTLSSAASIATVGWYGNTFGNSDPTSFTIDFYSNNDGLPGTLLDSTVVGDGSPVFDAVDADVLPVYDYSAAITPFSAAPGTEYWISIVADSDWAWEEGKGGNGGEVSIGYGLAQAGDADLAFSLDAAPTPEPSSLILLGTGLLGAAGIARRRFLRA